LPLRDATPADIEDLISLETRSFDGDRLSRRSFRRFIGASSAALRVARERGSLVGYALLLFRPDSDRARLYSIAVDPRARGTGTGARLLKDAEATARRRGRARLGLEVRADNRAAIALYRQAHYEPKGAKEDYYADGATALLFEKRLDGGLKSVTGTR
jgi:ribosomal protein S18 acetylase RimI-like enzyme